MSYSAQSSSNYETLEGYYNLGSSSTSLHSDPQQRFTLVRGVRETFEDQFLKELKKHNRNNEIGLIQEMIRNAKVTRNFGGIMYSVRLKASHAIILTSVGFFGPGTGRRGFYEIKIVVSEYQKVLPHESQNDLFRGKTVKRLEVEPGSIFEISLAQPIHVRAGRWIRIQFQLDGPETFMCNEVLSSYHCRDSNVHFEFHSSSHQMPTINYLLA